MSEHLDNPLIPITKDLYEEHKSYAINLVKSKPSWYPSGKAKRNRKGENETSMTGFSLSKVLPKAEPDKLEAAALMQHAVEVSNNRFVLSEHANTLLNILVDGICIAKYIAEQYKKSSGLLQLEEKNERDALHRVDQPKFS